MFKINDYIMYGTTGVCKVKDIVKEKDRDYIENEYYVLNPVYSDTTTIKIPVGNKKILMRPILSEKEVSLLINNIAENETIWIENDRERSSDFKSILKSGSCEELSKLIKTMHIKKKEKRAEGKKMNQTDLGIMKEAERLFNEELSITLNISPNEVSSYVLKNMPK